MKRPQKPRLTNRGESPSTAATQLRVNRPQRALEAAGGQNCPANVPKRVGGLEDALAGHPAFPPVPRQEAVERLCKLTGMKTERGAELILNQMMAMQVWHRDSDEGDKLVAAVELMMEFAPTSPAEALVAVQMFSVHEACLKLLRLATSPEQTAEGMQSLVMMSTRLMRVFNEQAELMAKLKGRTPEQKVTVEHVHVHHGGQAIVGAVSAPKTKPGEGEV